MSDSGESDVQTGDIHGHQTSAADTSALVSVHVDNVEVSRTEDNEGDEPEPGDQDNNRRRLNRRVDSAMSEQITASSNTTIDGLLLQQASRRQKRPTGPRRINTAPVNRTNVEPRQSLLPPPNERVEEISATRESREIKIDHVAVCGLCQGKSVDDLWLHGGSLRTIDNNERIIVERAARFEYYFGIHYLLTFILVTNRRFIVKQSWKYFGCNFQTLEAPHQFSDLQHVKVQRGIGMQQTRNRLLTFGGLSILSALPLGSGVVIHFIQTVLGAVAGLYGTHNLIMFLYSYNVNFVVVDVAKTNIVGSWKWNLGALVRGRSYLTIRMPLPVDACFEVMNELLKKHPSLPTLEDDVY